MDPRVPELVGREIEERRGEGVTEMAPEGRPQLDHRGEEGFSTGRQKYLGTQIMLT